MIFSRSRTKRARLSSTYVTTLISKISLIALLCIKYHSPTLIDVILTNPRNLTCNSINFDDGLNDCHDMVCKVKRQAMIRS